MMFKLSQILNEIKLYPKSQVQFIEKLPFGNEFHWGNIGIYCNKIFPTDENYVEDMVLGWRLKNPGWVDEKDINKLNLSLKNYLDKRLKKYHNINEIKIIPQPKKLKAFQNPSGAIYLIFNGKEKNSTLKNYINKIGWLDKKTNKFEFEIHPKDLDQFLKLLKQLRIPYEDITNDEVNAYKIIAIDRNLFDIKQCSKWDLYDKDIEKDKWFNFNRTLDEIKLQGSKLPIKGKNYIINFNDNYGDFENWFEYVGIKEPTEREKKLYKNKNFIYLIFKLGDALNYWEYKFGDKPFWRLPNQK